MITAEPIKAGTELTWRYDRRPPNRITKGWLYAPGLEVQRSVTDVYWNAARKELSRLFSKGLWPLMQRTLAWYMDTNNCDTEESAAATLGTKKASSCVKLTH